MLATDNPPKLVYAYQTLQNSMGLPRRLCRSFPTKARYCALKTRGLYSRPRRLEHDSVEQGRAQRNSLIKLDDGELGTPTMHAAVAQLDTLAHGRWMTT